MSDYERSEYHIRLNVSDEAIEIIEVAPRDEAAHRIVADEYEVIVYGDELVDTFVAIEIGRFIERKAHTKDS